MHIGRMRKMTPRFVQDTHGRLHPMPTAPRPGCHNPEIGYTKGMPNIDLADTPYRLDPATCRHGRQFPGDDPRGMRFVGTQFINNAFHTELNDLFRCDDCGGILKIPRDIKRAGRKGSKDVDDPRVIRTLRMNAAVDERFFKQYNDGRIGYFGRGFDPAIFGKREAS